MRGGPEGRPEWKRSVSCLLRGDGVIDDMILAISSFKLEMLMQAAKLESLKVASWIHDVTKWDRDITATGKGEPKARH
jgi:hypothetical protein